MPVQALKKEERKVKIAFFSNGFVVDDGELRDPNDPAGRAFLETLNRGFVPREIAEKYPNTDISVALEDRHDDEYVKQFKAFEGAGNRLAAPAAGSPSGAAAADRDSETPAGPFVFKGDEKAAKIVLQMVDGTKKEVQVNPERHTVADVRGVVAEHAKCSPSAFDLVVRELRPRPLDDATKTLAEVKAVNCIILVKLR